MKGLCDFTSHYFELHGVDTASRKWVDVKVRMEKTVELLDSIQGMFEMTETPYLLN